MIAQFASINPIDPEGGIKTSAVLAVKGAFSGVGALYAAFRGFFLIFDHSKHKPIWTYQY